MPYHSSCPTKRSILYISCILLASYHSALQAKPNDKSEIKIRGKSMELSQQQVSAQRIAKEDSLQKSSSSNKKEPRGKSTKSSGFTDALTQFDYSHWWASDGWHNGFPFVNRWQADAISHSSEGMQLTLSNQGTLAAPDWVSGELRSHEYRGYGCYEVSMKPAARAGVVSSFFLFASPYDVAPNGNGLHHEIDIEFLGDNTNFMQINFWRNGEPASGENALLIPLQFDAALDFHRYGIRWSSGKIQWYVDGLLVHQVNSKASPYIPTTSESTLMAMMNIWATHEDISTWAGEFDPELGASESYYKDFSYQTLKQCQF
ncbi:family 16 glycosylhydrolase [Shewanella sp. KX20019]|uniref:family 16 glycosylhydrolase n=1 Tax=Shewanella sp. KX20019 TaxID=2803864 RepID=UPI0019261CB8|nr:family 16 glycosylhydrolase [Shewanella sp. KX20019]QQX79835.1 family 16 glycosylhydrolase [Shewanella sp. KX20019]